MSHSCHVLDLVFLFQNLDLEIGMPMVLSWFKKPRKLRSFMLIIRCNPWFAKNFFHCVDESIALLYTNSNMDKGFDQLFSWWLVVHHKYCFRTWLTHLFGGGRLMITSLLDLIVERSTSKTWLQTNVHDQK